jgi:hypothetical protein
MAPTTTTTTGTLDLGTGMGRTARIVGITATRDRAAVLIRIVVAGDVLGLLGCVVENLAWRLGRKGLACIVGCLVVMDYWSRAEKIRTDCYTPQIADIWVLVDVYYRRSVFLGRSESGRI